ncbi:hypothetical protein GCM10027051_35610 [Niabella terrae]
MYFIKKPVLALICSMIAFILLAPACSKDESDATSSQPVLLSFGPTGVQPGEEIRFIGQHLDQVSAIVFAGENATVEQGAFSSQSAELITLVVPQMAQRGRVILKTSQGDIQSKSMFDMGIGATVSSLTAEARPGSSVTIKGSFLNWVTAVTFAENKPVTEFEQQSFDELVLQVPLDARTGSLLIQYSGTEAGDFETEQVLTVSLPEISSLDPVAARHDAEITLNGSNLDLVTQLFFTGVELPVTSFISQAATALKVKVPGGAIKGPLTMGVASGVQTVSTTELGIILPQAVSIAPAAVKHGENITITGTDLDLVSAVYFTNDPAAVTSFVSQSATQLVVKVPAGAKSGPLQLAVASGVTAPSATDLELIIPVITLLSPNPVTPLNNLTITGTHLDLVSSVNLENVAPVTSFISQSATSITVTVPAGTANGKVGLGIKNASVTTSSAMVLEVAGAAPPPQISHYIYNENLVNGFGAWGGWGNGNSVDLANESPVRIGNKSIKVVNGDAWGAALQLGGGSLDFGSLTVLKFSVYVTPEAVGKRVSIRMIDPYLPSDGDGNANTYAYTFGEAGKWHDVALPLSAFSRAATATGIKELSFQQMDGNFTIYLDEIGFN